jgi:hypothetical protein
MRDFKASLNIGVLRILGGGALLFGIVLGGTAAAKLPEARSTPDPFFDAPFTLDADGVATIAVASVAIPANTRQVGVEIREIEHQGRGDYVARCEWGGAPPRRLEATYREDQRHDFSGLELDLGRVEATGPTASLRATLTPPPQGVVRAAKLQLRADPPETSLGYVVVRLAIGFVVAAIGGVCLLVARWLRRESDREALRLDDGAP